MKHLVIRLIGVGILALAMPVMAQRAPLRLAVSANFVPALEPLLQDFSAKTGITTTLTSASSGTLFAQISKGAPYDVFLSADARRPQQLVGDQLAEQRSLVTYATGRLAYVSGNANLADTDALIKHLRHVPHRLAIAHPELAPYGKAAQQFLQASGLWPDYQQRLVRGKNVLQAWQYYETGNVNQVLVAASLVTDIAAGKIIIPAYLHENITQQLVILKSSQRQHDALRFVCFLVSPAAQQTLQDAGYEAVSQPELCQHD